MAELGTTMPPMVTETALMEREQEILREARQRWKDVSTDRQDLAYRKEAQQVLAFRDGKQWDPQVEQERRGAKRPCLTINTCGQYERQILNEPRRNRPAMQVRPVGDGADVDTAKVMQGLLRHIEQVSHAWDAYDWAYEDAVRQGRGYFRLVIEYADAMSFQQHVRIVPVFNAFAVYYGPARLPMYEDADYCFIVDTLPRAAFQAQYGVSSTQLEQWSGIGDQWITAEDVRVCEYFFKERQWQTLAMFPDGSTDLLERVLYQGAEQLDDPVAFEAAVCRLLRPQHGMRLLPWLRQQSTRLDEQLQAFPAAFRAEWVPQAAAVLREVLMARPTAQEQVYHTKLTGTALLESTVWPGTHIPIIPVFGNSLRLDNERRLSGCFQDALDPMRAKNYWVTMQAEHISLAPPPPWLTAEGQIDAYRQEWMTANRIPRASLTYRRWDDQGRDLGVPIRNAFEPPIQAITLAMQGSERDIEAALGIYRGSLGAPSQQQSGVALQKREEQVDTGTFHYGDNLRRALEMCGEQLLALIPKVYTTEMVQRIIGEDGGVDMVLLRPGGQEHGEARPPGVAGIYDMSVGTYDMVVDVGASYESKRQEALDILVNLSKSNAKVADLGADLIVKNVDAAGMEELERRLKKTLPPQFLEDAPNADPETQIAQLQGQLTQATQQMEAMVAMQEQIQQQMTQIQQENTLLKEGFRIKEQELVLQSRELDLDREKAQAEIAQGWEKLAIERDKVESSTPPQEQSRQRPPNER